MSVFAYSVDKLPTERKTIEFRSTLERFFNINKK